MIERLDHVNLVVDDLPAMAAFYEKLLGLRVTRRIHIGGPWIEALTGYDRVEADVVYLEAPGGSGLELICYGEPVGLRPAGAGEPNAPGIRHVAFCVTDLDAAVARLKAAGAELLSDVQRVPTTQVDFADRQKRIVYCRDPEGNLLELCMFS